ncbi:MAG TPA: endo-1,4-beta-xylanase [Herpetosiphonaceae bacterium]
MSTRVRIGMILAIIMTMLAPHSFPAPTAHAADPVVLVQSNFEDGTTQGWGPRGSGVVVAATDETSHAGTYSLKTTGRTENWHGPSLDLTGRLQQGATYAVEGYVRLVAGQPASTLKVTVQRETSAGTQWDQVASSDGVTDAAWVRLAGEYSYSDASSLQLYIESSDPTSQYYLDDLIITQLSSSDPGQPSPGTSSDFEDGTAQGWAPRIGGETVAVTSADKHGGSYSLLTTGRQNTYDGPSLNILNTMTRGAKYAISLWVKLAPGEADANLRVSIQRSYQGNQNYDTVVGNTLVTANQWVNLKGDYTLSNTVDGLSIYVESDSGTPAFYMDDFTMTYVPPQPLPPIQTDIPSVYQTLAPYFPIGAAIEPSQLDSSRHVQLLTRHFNSIVAENVMKPGLIQPVEGQFNWTDADKLVQFARANNMEMRGHTLVWHQQNPDWLFKDAGGNDLQPGAASKALVLQRLEAHIRAVVGRYKDDIDSWDVVNEVIDPVQTDCMRRSPWYTLTGLDYIATAFRVAREVAPNAKLFINDYSTTDSRKRECIYNLVRDLKAQGVPIDGVGHQMHINIESPSGALIEQTIQLFAGLGLDNQITELDMSIYTNSSDSYTTVPEEILIKQGYRYQEVFEAFKRQRDHISSVVFWGIADDHTWLKTFPIDRLDLPLLFDEQQQAKYAYWGIVDPSRLPVLMKQRDVPQGSPRLDGSSEIAWDMLPATAVGDKASFKLLWSGRYLYLLADVQDATNNPLDTIDVFVDENNGKTSSYESDDARYTIRRDRYQSRGVDAKIVNTSTGYRVEAAIRLKTSLVENRPIGFDIRFTDAGSTAAPISWNDTTNRQDGDTSTWGTLTPVAAVKLARAIHGTPTIDGNVDAGWSKAPEISTGTWVLGTSGSTARVKTMWDANRLYVLSLVTDSRLSKASANPWEQDSVEIFVDQNNGKTSSYESDDAQYRVNYANEQSFGGAASADKFVTATRIVPGGYVVEAAITLDAVPPQENGFIGFDVQVNNDEQGDGTRSSVVTWSDPSGQSYQNTSRFGVLQFVRK